MLPQSPDASPPGSVPGRNAAGMPPGVPDESLTPEPRSIQAVTTPSGRVKRESSVSQPASRPSSTRSRQIGTATLSPAMPRPIECGRS